jgi:hypothetical protein
MTDLSNGRQCQDRKTDRQIERKTDRQIDRKTDKQIERKTEKRKDGPISFFVEKINKNVI